jgi:hypothetical protein
MNVTKKDPALRLEHKIINRYRILSEKEWGYILKSNSQHLGDFIYNRILLAPTPESNLDNCPLSASELFDQIKTYISKLIIKKGLLYKGLIYIDSGTDIDIDDQDLSIKDIFKHITVRIYFSDSDDKSNFFADWNSEHDGYDFNFDEGDEHLSPNNLITDQIFSTLITRRPSIIGPFIEGNSPPFP